MRRAILAIVGVVSRLRWGTLYIVPVYEYRCNACTEIFEVLRPMAERELAAVCPNCESRASMPLISTVAVRAGSSTREYGAAASGGGGCCDGGGCSCGRN